MSYTIRVEEERWKKAQEGELKVWLREPDDGDDWNQWWFEKFSNYSFLKELGKKVESVYEVGCGPYAKNLDHVIKVLGYEPERIILEDPLLEKYYNANKSISRFSNNPKAIYISSPMEKISFSELKIDKVDVLICNNVLDHVQDVDKCFEHIYSSLKTGGVFIFGQDLTSDEDIQKYPEADEFHPIRLNEKHIKLLLNDDYEALFEKLLSREEGRNPDAHYATILYAGLKK